MKLMVVLKVFIFATASFVKKIQVQHMHQIYFLLPQSLYGNQVKIK